MKLNRKKLVLFVLILSIFFYFLVSKAILTDNKQGVWYDQIHRHIPKSVKKIMKKTIFFVPELKRQLEYEKNKNTELKIKNEKYRNVYLNYLYQNIDYINFELKSKKKIKTNNKTYNFMSFESDLLLNGKNKEARASAYIEYFDGNLFLMEGNGLLAFIENFNKDDEKLEAKVIKTNFREIVKDEEFYRHLKHGIKDILIDKNKIFVSFTNKIQTDCFNTSILVGDLNYDYIKFEKLFSPGECVKKDSEICLYDLNVHASGGRIVSFLENKILLSIGSFTCKALVQNDESIFGKIISIDINTKDYSIISKGHRNPQGLYYNSVDNVILSTEHGPYGGDEVNIILKPGEKVENFGWPISSYGEHYAGTLKKHKAKGTWEKMKKIAPLHKSHEKFGFKEPTKFFVPSIGISELIKVPISNNLNFSNDYFVTSMGRDIFEGDLSVHHLNLDKKHTKVLNHEIIPIGERIRDIEYAENINSIVLFLETTGSIGILEIN